MSKPNPIFCAIDTADINHAKKLATELRGHVGGIKLGLEFFMKFGAQGYREMSGFGLPIFLDVKLHDIPNTVAGAMTSLGDLDPAFITIHTSGGTAMMKAAAKAASAMKSKPKVLGVTVLTSLDTNDLTAIGQTADTAQQVSRLARLARESGLDGVICSPEEVKNLLDACGKDFILMVPGIRPEWAAANDQKRVMTPRQAIDAGATYLVIGRPITAADNPAAAADRIMAELA